MHQNINTLSIHSISMRKKILIKNESNQANPKDVSIKLPIISMFLPLFKMMVFVKEMYTIVQGSYTFVIRI